MTSDIRHPEEPVTLGEMRALVEQLARQIGELRREVEDLKTSIPGKMNEPPTRKDA
jgi:phage host-nuclease inhibitor protein Gam